jgi:hypothetical protein
MTRLHRMMNARVLGVVLLFLTASCAKNLPTAPTTPDPQHGAPTKIDLTFTDGFGEHAGTATLIAHVIDAFAAAVPDVPVTFEAESGTLADSLVKTDDKGNATTTLTADPGSVRVHARVSDSVTTMTIVAVQAKPVPPTVPPTPTPQPPPPVPPPSPSRPDYGVVLSAAPSSVLVNTSSTLTATVTVPSGAPAPATFSWDCGNGTPTTTTSLNVMTCNYTTAGNATAKVTVNGGTGATTTFGFASTTISVTAPTPPPAPPTPEVTVNCGQNTPPALTLNCNVQAKLNGAFVNSSDITHVDWDWGDHSSSSSNDNLGTHLYAGANTYTIVASNVTVNGTTAKGSGSTSKLVQ